MGLASPESSTDYLQLGLCLGSESIETRDSSGPLGAPLERYPLSFGTLPGETGRPASSLPFEAGLL